MDIIIAIHKQWAEKIFDGSKTIDFRAKLPKAIKNGTKIYLYETAKDNGSQKVVGECTVDYIIPVLSEEGKWPIYGAYPFIDYFYENIKKDKKTATFYRRLKKEFNNHPKYRYGFIIGYAFSPLQLNSLRLNKCLLKVEDIMPDMQKVNEISNEYKKSEDMIEECDNWLREIGFYDDGDESKYQYGIVLKDVKKYDQPIDLHSFVNKTGNAIQAPPQSYIYGKLST